VRFFLGAAFGAAFSFLTPVAFAQSVLQVGPVAPGNVPQWLRNGYVGDSGISLAFIKTLLPFSPGQTVTNLNMTATLVQSTNVAWAGGYPGTNNVGIYLTQQYSGLSTGCYNDSAGCEIPLNLIQVNESMTGTSVGGVNGLTLIDHYGGGSATGSHNGMFIDTIMTDAIGGTTNLFEGALSVGLTIAANAGGTPSAAQGDAFAYAGFMRLSANDNHGQPIYWNEIDGFEMDVETSPGANFKWGEGMSIVDLSASHASVFETALNIRPAGWTWNNAGIFFGALPPNTGLPVSVGGTLILSNSGTAADGIDFSAATFSDAFLKGPSGFRVDGNNTVHTDSIRASTGPGGDVQFLDAGGNPTFRVQGLTSGTQNTFIMQAQPSGTDPTLETGGPSDPNIGMTLLPKGTGVIRLSGSVQAAALVTSCSSQPTGTLWDDSETVKVCP